uniref:Uncharacterized protein n=1 Tax=Rhizophagus irregularis (strain DAOM 181602 / DAOM 197198 / MUCL 43194) TaxID=747089 RepID=U9U0C0_RHIID
MDFINTVTHGSSSSDDFIEFRKPLLENTSNNCIVLELEKNGKAAKTNLISFHLNSLVILVDSTSNDYYEKQRYIADIQAIIAIGVTLQNENCSILSMLNQLRNSSKFKVSSSVILCGLEKYWR